MCKINEHLPPKLTYYLLLFVHVYEVLLQNCAIVVCQMRNKGYFQCDYNHRVSLVSNDSGLPTLELALQPRFRDNYCLWTKIGISNCHSHQNEIAKSIFPMMFKVFFYKWKHHASMQSCVGLLFCIFSCDYKFFIADNGLFDGFNNITYNYCFRECVINEYTLNWGLSDHWQQYWCTFSDNPLSSRLHYTGEIEINFLVIRRGRHQGKLKREQFLRLGKVLMQS